MNYGKFDKVVKCYLGSNYNIAGVPGIYKGKEYDSQGNPYMHILNIPKNKTQEEVVINSNLLPEIKTLQWIPIKLHYLAHHLNSSQIMCYNFFRRFIDNDYIPSPSLITLLHNYCPLLKLEENAECQFEFIEIGEDSNIDFYLKSGDVKVYCEIKYSEQCFGKSGGGKNPTQKFEKKYKPLFEGSPGLWKCKVSEKSVMKNYYQLFRNAIKAQPGKNYVLFICPEDRTDLEKSFLDFKDKFLMDDEMIQYVYWEDLIRISESLKFNMDSFKKKYFGYKNENPASL